MSQDVGTGYASEELTSIKVQPDHPVFYPYQMPTPVAPMPNYARSGTVKITMV